MIAAADIERFRALIAERLGLHHDERKSDVLADLLRRRLAAGAAASPATYLDRLASEPGELRALVEPLTVAETFFFRNADHFRALAEAVLPARIRARASEQRLRILSAGCASGEEAYSLALAVRSVLPDLAAWDVRITGIDVNPAVLARAARASYSTWSLRATPDDVRQRWFRAEGRDFALDPAVRAMVNWQERNLAADDPGFWRGLDCDMVFCRNVIMYFTPAAMRTVVARLAEALVPGGFLFLGHAETLRGLSHDFDLCHSHDTFYYQRRGGERAAVVAENGLAGGMPRWDHGGGAASAPAADGKDGTAPAAPASAVSTPAVSAPAATVPPGTAPWFDAIKRASARIASLVGEERRDAAAPAPPVPSPRPAPPRRDLGPALAALQEERFADALGHLGDAQANADSDADALLLRAVLLTHAGRLVEAEAACARLLAVDGLSAGAHHVRSLCRAQAGDDAGAIAHAEIAVHLDPGFAMARLHLGIMARRAGDHARARRELDQASTLLAGEDAARVLLFGGGFPRAALLRLCRSELAALGAAEDMR